jgi:electron transfer flavoprotein alpha subunit
MNLVYLEIAGGKIKKSSLEALYYAEKLGGGAIALAIGNAEQDALHDAGAYGADKVVQVKADHFENNRYADIIAACAKENNAANIIISNTYNGKSIAPRVAVKLNASIISGVVDFPADGQFKKGVFSGKAFAYVSTESETKVITLTPNTFSLPQSAEAGKNTQVQEAGYDINNKVPATKSIETIKAGGKIPLTEAEVVISAGRGLKGPENWGMIEELAGLLGAATACSKPVSDMHWRPHTEHVGQTGITIKPNLYIAVGISGAIQHLAGISSSKVIVAVNKDPEAPIFKIADFGIVGDAFEVVPRFIEAAKAMKK